MDGVGGHVVPQFEVFLSHMTEISSRTSSSSCCSVARTFVLAMMVMEEVEGSEGGGASESILPVDVDASS